MINLSGFEKRIDDEKRQNGQFVCCCCCSFLGLRQLECAIIPMIYFFCKAKKYENAFYLLL